MMRPSAREDIGERLTHPRSERVTEDLRWSSRAEQQKYAFVAVARERGDVDELAVDRRWSNEIVNCGPQSRAGAQRGDLTRSATLCVMLMKCASICPTRTVSPAWTVMVSTFVNLCSLSLPRSRRGDVGAVDRHLGWAVRLPPMWSSWAWVRSSRAPSAAFQQVRDLVDHEIHAQHLFFGKLHAGIDDDDVVAGLVDGHVAADLAAAAERDDSQVFLIARGFGQRIARVARIRDGEKLM